MKNTHKHREMKTARAKIEKIYGGYIMRCPECGKVIASASQKRNLPQWADCDDCNPPITWSTRSPSSDIGNVNLANAMLGLNKKK